MTISLVEPIETDVRAVALGDLYVKRQSVNPAQFSDEQFELFSVPAYERNAPDLVSGSAIGSSKVSVEEGDTLICRIVPHIRRAWVVPKSGGFRQIASGEWIILRDPEVDPTYLRHVLLSDPFHDRFMSTVAGVGGSLMRARPAQAADIRIPLPPLPEQRRIAAILDQADELRTQRRKALALLEDLIDAAFAALYGAGGAGKVQSVSLGELADVQTGPFGSLLHTTDYVSGGVPLVNPMHIKKGQIVPDLEFSISDSKFEELHRFALQSGDVVLGRRGEMGRAAEVLGSHGRLICGTGSMVVRPKQGKATGAVLARLLSSPSARRQLEKAAQGVTMLNLNQSIVASVRVSVPDYAEQHAFAQTRDSLDAQKERLKSHLAHLDELFASLQHRAFRGEL